MKREEKADLNWRALLALGGTFNDDPRSGSTIWKNPDGHDLYYAKGYDPDLIGNPDGTGGCWGQVMVTNGLAIRPDGDYWRVYNRYGIQTLHVVGDSPGESFARWCIEAEKAGLKPKWRKEQANVGAAVRRMERMLNIDKDMDDPLQWRKE